MENLGILCGLQIGLHQITHLPHPRIGTYHGPWTSSLIDSDDLGHLVWTSDLATSNPPNPLPETQLLTEKLTFCVDWTSYLRY